MTQSNLRAAGSLWSKVVFYSERQWVRCFSPLVLGAGVHLPALQGQLIWDDFLSHARQSNDPALFSPTLTRDITVPFKRSQPRQYLLLSNILTKIGRTDEAHAALTQVTRLQATVQTDSIVN